MQIILNPDNMQTLSLGWRREGRQIAFVPTMGALHGGHMSLISHAKSHPSFKAGRDKIVASIFVNPLQFGAGEDLTRYPRPIEADKAKCDAAGVDCLFLPTPDTLYPPHFQTTVHLSRVTQGLCGDSRPGHFDGVSTVVLKLFNIVQPHWACFGEKDFQQLAVIRRMVADLAIPVEIIPCPIVRDPDGLAMSSRNVYLSADSRQQALALPRALQEAQAQIRAGIIDLATIKPAIETHLLSQPDITIDYIEFVDRHTLTPLSVYQSGTTQLLIAIKIGRDKPVRLIDNVAL